MRKRGAGERKGGKGNVGKSFYSLHTQIPWLRNGSQQIRGCWVEWKLCCSCRDGWLCGPRMLTHVWKNKGMIPCPDHRHPAPSTHTHTPPPPPRVSGIHGPTAGHSIGRPFATKAPFSQQNRMPVSQAEFAICAASTDLRLKLINPGRAPVTINCTSQSCIFK